MSLIVNSGHLLLPTELETFHGQYTAFFPGFQSFSGLPFGFLQIRQFPPYFLVKTTRAPQNAAP